MKTIIAGSRSIPDPYHRIAQAIKDSGFEITEVVSGTCRGVDLNGELYAKCNNLPVKRFPADWEKHGKSAGPIRNCEMAKYAEALIAIWDGKSSGTKDMIDKAKFRGLKVHVHEVEIK